MNGAREDGFGKTAPTVFAVCACLVACARTPPPQAPKSVVPIPTQAKLGEPTAHSATEVPAVKAKPACTGTVSRDLYRALDATIAESHDCFYSTLARDPDATGEIILGMVVQANGTPTKIATMVHGFRDPETVQCVVGVFAQASYTSTPPENGCVTLYIPIDLMARSVRNPTAPSTDMESSTPPAPALTAPALTAPALTAPPEKMRAGCDNPLPDALKRAFGATALEARDCFYELLAREPGASGKIVINVLVQQDGTVRTIRPVSNTFRDQETTNCMVGVFARASYSSTPPDGCASVNVPIALPSAEEKRRADEMRARWKQRSAKPQQ